LLLDGYAAAVSICPSDGLLNVTVADKYGEPLASGDWDPAGPLTFGDVILEAALQADYKAQMLEARQAAQRKRHRASVCT